MGVVVVATFHRGTLLWSPPTEKRAPPPTWRLTSTQSYTSCSNGGALSLVGLYKLNPVDP